MAKEIKAKVLLSTNKNPSKWFGVNYLFNLLIMIYPLNQYQLCTQLKDLL